MSEIQNKPTDKNFDLVDIEVIKNSHHIIDGQRDPQEAKDMKEILSEMKSLEETLEKILIRTTNRYLKKGNLPERKSMLKRNGSEIFSQDLPVVGKLNLAPTQDEYGISSKRSKEDEGKEDQLSSKRQSLQSENSSKQASSKQRSSCG